MKKKKHKLYWNTDNPAVTRVSVFSIKLSLLCTFCTVISEYKGVHVNKDTQAR